MEDLEVLPMWGPHGAFLRQGSQVRSERDTGGLVSALKIAAPFLRYKGDYSNSPKIPRLS